MKPLIQTLKGFRDFLPQEKRARDFVMGKIKEAFERFGFEPLETPTLEYADLLLGKYGTEADKLVYTFEDKGGRRVGLKYDQTVPTARVLSQYQNQLPRYFRRYQIQNVFRADKPQQGRFREFTQCDIDIFGSPSPVADAELMATTYFAYKNIGFPEVKLSFNFRPLLINDFSKYATATVPITSILQSLDKLDKESSEQIVTELTNKGLDPVQANEIVNTIKVQIGEPQELASIRIAAEKLVVPTADLVFNRNLVRGLDYYTGMIFEVKIPGYDVGSVGGGGRYDNLIKDLGGPDIPAVGMAFGFDRTVEAAKQLNLIPPSTSTSKVLVTIFDASTQNQALALAAALRQTGINTEVYPALDKLPKQFAAAAKAGIPFVTIIGPDEAQKNMVTLKNMATGEQTTNTLENIIPLLK